MMVNNVPASMRAKVDQPLSFSEALDGRLEFLVCVPTIPCTPTWHPQAVLIWEPLLCLAHETVSSLRARPCLCLQAAYTLYVQGVGPCLAKGGTQYAVAG